jgi:hypothetical protein
MHQNVVQLVDAVSKMQNIGNRTGSGHEQVRGRGSRDIHQLRPTAPAEPKRYADAGGA